MVRNWSPAWLGPPKRQRACRAQVACWQSLAERLLAPRYCAGIRRAGEIIAGIKKCPLGNHCVSRRAHFFCAEIRFDAISFGAGGTYATERSCLQANGRIQTQPGKRPEARQAS